MSLRTSLWFKDIPKCLISRSESFIKEILLNSMNSNSIELIHSLTSIARSSHQKEWYTQGTRTDPVWLIYFMGNSLYIYVYIYSIKSASFKKSAFMTRPQNKIQSHPEISNFIRDILLSHPSLWKSRKIKSRHSSSCLGCLTEPIYLHFRQKHFSAYCVPGPYLGDVNYLSLTKI